MSQQNAIINISAINDNNHKQDEENHKKYPPIWLILLIVGFPLFSETVYTPSLPSIVHYMACSPSQAENTLSFYLVGFAFGTMLWGNLSDHIGRKKSLIIGLIGYLLACIGCYWAKDISTLTIMRFLQALGGSSGSVLGQVICRDSFKGKRLAQVYSAIGMTIGVFPAIGPILGGIIAHHTHWQNIFIFLFLFDLGLIFSILYTLPETAKYWEEIESTSKLANNNNSQITVHKINDNHSDHDNPALLHKKKKFNLTSIAKKMIRTPQTMCCAVIVTICQGMGFSYFSEAPFIFIENLGLTPSQYGTTFTIVASAGMIGGFTNKKMLKFTTPYAMLRAGIVFYILGNLIFFTAASFDGSNSFLSKFFSIILSKKEIITYCITGQIFTRFGVSLLMINGLMLSLYGQTHNIGTASSIFSTMTYSATSLITFGMSYFHDGMSNTMPIYFLIIIAPALIATAVLQRHKHPDFSH